MKRVLILTDDELELLLSWGEVARSEPQDGVLHDWEDTDDALYEKVSGERLK